VYFAAVKTVVKNTSCVALLENVGKLFRTCLLIISYIFVLCQ